jgi:hypothetical protein
MAAALERRNGAHPPLPPRPRTVPLPPIALLHLVVAVQQVISERIDSYQYEE